VSFDPGEADTVSTHAANVKAREVHGQDRAITESGGATSNRASSRRPQTRDPTPCGTDRGPRSTHHAPQWGSRVATARLRVATRVRIGVAICRATARATHRDRGPLLVALSAAEPPGPADSPVGMAADMSTFGERVGEPFGAVLPAAPIRRGELTDRMIDRLADIGFPDDHSVSLVAPKGARRAAIGGVIGPVAFVAAWSSTGLVRPHYSLQARDAAAPNFAAALASGTNMTFVSGSRPRPGRGRPRNDAIRRATMTRM
jgi:hypothetical protein